MTKTLRILILQPLLVAAVFLAGCSGDPVPTFGQALAPTMAPAPTAAAGQSEADSGAQEPVTRQLWVPTAAPIPFPNPVPGRTEVQSTSAAAVPTPVPLSVPGRVLTLLPTSTPWAGVEAYRRTTLGGSAPADLVLRRPVQENLDPAKWDRASPPEGPPPIVGVDTGPGTWALDPEILAILVRQDSGDTTVPETLHLQLTWMPETVRQHLETLNRQNTEPDDLERLYEEDLTNGPVVKFLTQNGAVMHGDMTFTVPTKILSAFLRRPETMGALLEGKDRREWSYYAFGLVEGLEGPAAAAVLAYELGLPEEVAALYDPFSKGGKVWLSVESRNPQEKAKLIAWLEDNGVYVTPESKGAFYSTDHRQTDVLVPVRLLKALSERPEASRISTWPLATHVLQRHYWTDDQLELARIWADWYSPPEERRYTLRLPPTPRPDYVTPLPPREAPPTAAMEVEPTPTPLPTATPAVWPTPVLAVETANADIPEFNPDDWVRWVDMDGDCRDTRQEILVRDNENPDLLIFTDEQRCVVLAGLWGSRYVSGYGGYRPDWTTVAHMVPLENAHRSGGWKWDSVTKMKYANSLADLYLTNWHPNQGRDNNGPENWRPYEERYWCDYARDWIDTKRRWNLTATAEEVRALHEMLATCGG